MLCYFSAGIGRTGTFIGLNELYKEGKNSKRINVKHYVRKMREYRMNMVQKPVGTKM